MCCCAIECVQCCVSFLNVTLMLSGIGLLIASIVLFINGLAGSLAILVPSLPYIYVANLLLIAAVIILCVSCFGCVVAYRADVCALIWYYILIVIVLCLEASVLVMTFTHWRSGGYHPQIQDYITQRAQLTIGRYGQEGEDKLTSVWDDLQLRKQCCGVISHLDWYKFNNQFSADRPPDSCCETYYEGCSRAISAVIVWDEGCGDYLIDETFRGLGAIGTIVLICFLLQVLLLLFVAILIFLHKFGNDPKNTCCGGSYSKPEDTKYDEPKKPRPVVQKSSSWRLNPLYNSQLKVDKGTDL